MQYLGRLNTQNYLIQNNDEILGKVVLANLETRHKALKKNGLRQIFLPNYNKNVIIPNFLPHALN